MDGDDFPPKNAPTPEQLPLQGDTFNWSPSNRKHKMPYQLVQNISKCQMCQWYCIRIRTRRGMYGQNITLCLKEFPRAKQSPGELLKAMGYIWPYVPSRVLIRTFYYFNKYLPHYSHWQWVRILPRECTVKYTPRSKILKSLISVFHCIVKNNIMQFKVGGWQ